MLILFSGNAKAAPASLLKLFENLMNSPQAVTETEGIYLPLTLSSYPWVSPFGGEATKMFVENEALYSLTLDLNIGWTRLNKTNGISWRKLQPNPGDEINWDLLADFEDQLRILQAAGITPVISLNDSPHWAVDPNARSDGQPTSCGPIHPNFYDEFADFLQKLIKRYKAPEFNVHIWEFGNEPDVDPDILKIDSVYGCWGDISDTDYYGGKKYGDYSETNRQMMPQLRKFLYSQKVQSPFEIYTDWLTVGHVDEIICFVPVVNDIGFQVLVASPQRAKAILERLQFQGHGTAKMFVGMMRGEPGSGENAEISINEILNDRSFWFENDSYQTIMNSNISILKKELNIGDENIIQIPVLFHPTGSNRTAAYFPDMVNHLVINSASIVPKPHGPIIDGECAFEKAFRGSFPERDVMFVDDWYSYHEILGEVHCGTNIQRKSFANKPWWNHKPDGSYDI